MNELIRHGLFSVNFLQKSIVRLDNGQNFDADDAVALEQRLWAALERFPSYQSPNESQTEDELIWPILGRLIAWKGGRLK